MKEDMNDFIIALNKGVLGDIILAKSLILECMVHGVGIPGSTSILQVPLPEALK